MNEDPVWITGGGGLIGNYLVQSAAESAPGWTIVGLSRSQLDLTDFGAVRLRFKSERPKLVIHCAALSRSPECQANPERARILNVEVTGFLSELAKEIPFIFLSSDLVFDGRKGNYDESAPVSPLGVYAETKVAAEQKVLSNPKHTVLRTSLNGGTSPTGDRGFNEQLRNVWLAGKTANLFSDEVRCPIPASVTARAIWELVGSGYQPGLYHLAGSQRLSRWQIGQLLAARWPQLNPKLVATSIADFPGAPRPTNASLACAKIQRLLSFPLPGLSEWLEAHPEVPF
jgi:dTDP-4-dehydrorhamnose reductase